MTDLKKKKKRLKTAAEYAHVQIRVGRLTGRDGEKEVDWWDFKQWFNILQSGTLRDCPGKKNKTNNNPAAVSPPPLRFKALAFILQTDEWHSVRLLFRYWACLFLEMIKLKAHSEKTRKRFDFFFFFFLVNGSQMMFWCGLTQAHTNTCIHTHTHTQIPSFLSSLTLHHHANPACFTRQETERLIVIPQGSADLSQICLCLAPHSTSFPYCLAPRNQKISHLWDLLEMWEICEWSPPSGGFLTRAAGKSEGKAEQRWRRRQRKALLCS